VGLAEKPAPVASLERFKLACLSSFSHLPPSTAATIGPRAISRHTTRTHYTSSPGTLAMSFRVVVDVYFARSRWLAQRPTESSLQEKKNLITYLQYSASMYTYLQNRNQEPFDVANGFRLIFTRGACHSTSMHPSYFRTKWFMYNTSLSRNASICTSVSLLTSRNSYSKTQGELIWPLRYKTARRRLTKFKLAAENNLTFRGMLYPN